MYSAYEFPSITIRAHALLERKVERCQMRLRKVPGTSRVGTTLIRRAWIAICAVNWHRAYTRATKRPDSHSFSGSQRQKSIDSWPKKCARAARPSRSAMMAYKDPRGRRRSRADPRANILGLGPKQCPLTFGLAANCSFSDCTRPLKSFKSISICHPLAGGFWPPESRLDLKRRRRQIPGWYLRLP
jgi:hypothetical protein